MAMIDLLIDTQSLHAQLPNPRIKLVEASWDLNNHDYGKQFQESALPGAVFFDLEALSDHSLPYPHCRLSSTAFGHFMSRLGLRNDDEIIVYDRTGLFSAPRCAWNLRAMGAKSVRILNGGFQAWCAQFPTQAGNISSPVGQFEATDVSDFWIDIERVKATYHKSDTCILDARSNDRFRALVTESRPHVRSGHIPGSISLPYGHVIENGFFKNRTELMTILAPILTQNPSKIITSCGSGVTAAIIATAIEGAGYKRPVIFDGSWAQWGDEKSGLPIAIG